MRRIGPRPLWLGHAGDLRDVRALFDAGIEAVVELADSEPPAVLPRGLIRVRFPLSDDDGNPPHLLRLAVESVAGLIRAGVPTLVCCSAGMSRSVCIAAAGIAVVERRAFRQVLEEVTPTGPADVSPGLYIRLAQAIPFESAIG